eukprot:TRINITY_DN5895_c0_g1_i1.p1 TRINITY_DN5895_c0_g1~~TRINITY_DN5895_c0_g1_i1.p1  ORF type:complete len:331 (-),score=79.95 TRINITY_DN5895_c0_g1_i1:83-1075(-)
MKLVKNIFLIFVVLYIIFCYYIFFGREVVSDTPLTYEQCMKKWSVDHKDDAGDMNNDPLDCPREPPKQLRDEYTQNGKISIVNWYKCQTGPEYEKGHSYSKSWIDENIERVTQRLENYYGKTDRMLYNAIDAHPFKGKSVLITGSQRPIYESVCIVFGAESCTTMDFQPIEVEDDRLRTITIAQYDANPETFDAAISISSFEHDGLGRYGDPLRPSGDLEMMKKMKCIINPNGILYLSVPIAKDKIVWNMHRVYGKHRLPLLIENWKLLGVYADAEMKKRWSGCDSDKEGDYQPILVLENTIPEPGHNLKVLNEYDVPELRTNGEWSCYR